ncbi:hypothetical protein [Pseudomonas sp. PD9R]|uniref:hypothetical protein n=1 Tax=Pseudomonas sp. PD9R TaxID=2853534 RepID=UPI001C487378|nr:hypothetical protein [Pseudomonas sp. PD9R]MBV6824627.1 hypothetical protein [Pseudomonas sp. PD9R]
MKIFFESLECLADVVHQVIVPKFLRNEDAPPIALIIRSQLSVQGRDPEKMADIFMAATRTLLSQRSEQLRDVGEQITVEEADHLYVELLAGACIGLYFLGVPMGQPWDRVLQWVESDGGGLPNGVCVAKAIGDLVRAERKATVDPELLVRSYLPVALFRELIRDGAVLPRAPCPQDRPLHCAAVAAGVLGRCYELLQICLYVREGRSISYVVPRSLIQKMLGITPESAEEHVHPRWEQMCDWLDYVFHAPKLDRQHVCIIDPVGLPACFINRSSGLFTFERVTDTDDARDFPLPASYMRSGRRLQYSNQLRTERDFAITQGNLLSREMRPDVLKSLLMA